MKLLNSSWLPILPILLALAPPILVAFPAALVDDTFVYLPPAMLSQSQLEEAVGSETQLMMQENNDLPRFRFRDPDSVKRSAWWPLIDPGNADDQVRRMRRRYARLSNSQLFSLG